MQVIEFIHLILHSSDVSIRRSQETRNRPLDGKSSISDEKWLTVLKIVSGILVRYSRLVRNYHLTLFRGRP